ncbi:hypothetical protein N665_0217s0004 [Sinapis alba]|nr:hypothetical protein N665_0217s0004 [Sinapis alba]
MVAMFFSRSGDVLSLLPELVLNKQKKNAKGNHNVLFWLDMKCSCESSTICRHKSCQTCF